MFSIQLKPLPRYKTFDSDRSDTLRISYPARRGKQDALVRHSGRKKDQVNAKERDDRGDNDCDFWLLTTENQHNRRALDAKFAAKASFEVKAGCRGDYRGQLKYFLQGAKKLLLRQRITITH